MKKIIITAMAAMFFLACNPETKDKTDENSTVDNTEIKEAEQVLEKAEAIETESEELENLADSLLNSIEKD